MLICVIAASVLAIVSCRGVRSSSASGEPGPEKANMRAVASFRLTRIVTGENNVEVAELGVALRRIQAALHGIPAAERDYIANALLSEAARRIAEGDGRERERRR
jgi:hypothetical protein